MPTRREVLAGSSGILVGGAAVGFVTTDDTADEVKQILGQDLQTETIAKRVNKTTGRVTSSPIDTVTMYESGAAELLFAKDHGCFERIAFGHRANQMPGDAYKTWQLPDFEGPLTVDLKGVVEGNAPYPSNSFQLTLLAAEDGACLSMSESTIRFQVPESYLP